VSGRAHVRKPNLDGDQQFDLTVHGGVDKAVYVYPSEHYAFWRDELPTADLGWGAFGENFTTEGTLEDPLTCICAKSRALSRVKSPDCRPAVQDRIVLEVVLEWLYVITPC